MHEESEGPESIVQRDDDRALPRERPGIVALLAAEPREEAAAVDPHHDGTSPAGVWRPDVQVQAVFGLADGVGVDVAVRLVLHAVVSEMARVTHARPAGDRLRRAPAQVADGWDGVRDALEHERVARRIDASRERAGVDRDARCEWNRNARRCGAVREQRDGTRRGRGCKRGL